MPNKLMPWNAFSGVENPKNSVEVNELIKKVKKKEVRHQGAQKKSTEWREDVSSKCCNQTFVELPFSL
jgi:hypothetical protein